MKLYYYQRPDGKFNFGDDLNYWLWPKLIPHYFDEDPETVFVGFGTLLNNLLPQRVSPAKKVLIFSTGAGYERKLKYIPSHFKIYSVRGPYSTQVLNLSPTLAITDAAILVKQCWKYGQFSRDQVSFMPHIDHATIVGEKLKKLCEEINIQYINPAEKNLELIFNQIDHSQILFTEAMHGAIVADAFRVPWVPVCSGARILPFKWQDWCASIQTPYQPIYLPPLAGKYPPFVKGIRSGLQVLQYWSRVAQNAPFSHLKATFVSTSDEIFQDILLKASRSGKGFLSTSARLDSLSDRLLNILETLQKP